MSALGVRRPASTCLKSRFHLHLRRFHLSTHHPTQKWTAPPTLPNPNPSSFQDNAISPSQPIQFPAGHFTSQLPAIQKWFCASTLNPNSSLPSYDYLSPYADSTFLPMELTTTTTTNTTSSAPPASTFHRATPPLSLFLAYTRLHQPTNRITIAQAPLSALPPALHDDLLTPSLLSNRDIYASNLWLGLAPTATPLHRDPNPNLFVQIAGRKRVRMLAPEVGEKVFAAVRPGGGRGMVRGEEMMVGGEGEGLERVVWGLDVGDEVGLGGEGDVEGLEVEIEAGGGLFIPRGWWHAVRGVGEGVVGSVNWWFR